MKTINNLNSEQNKTRLNLLNQIIMKRACLYSTNNLHATSDMRVQSGLLKTEPSRIKKQLLLLIVAFFAVTSAFGQPGKATAGTAPDPSVKPSCNDDPLHPIAGKTYEYSATNNQNGGKYTWWATTETQFITAKTLNNGAGKYLTTPDVTPVAGSGYADYNVGDDEGKIKLIWGSNTLAAAMGATPTPTFVAVHYDASGAATGCTDNFKIYKIEPINAFTVDILSLNNDATLTAEDYGEIAEQCFDDVNSAEWDGSAMKYDYGTNVLYFEVVAANFTDSWTPTFQIAGLAAGQTATLEWDVVKTFASAVNIGAITNSTPIASTTAVETDATDTSAGVSIYVRVTVKNNGFEGLANTDITLAVTGENAAGQNDVKVDCSAATFADNQSTHTLNARPTVTSSTVDFATPTPNVLDFE